MSSRKYELDFFTATIQDWKLLLANDLFKDIIIDSLRFLVDDKRVYVTAFAIMHNHQHILWHIRKPNTLEKVQQSFLRYTAQNIIKELRNNDHDTLAQYYTGAADRKHQIWKRNPLSIGVWSEDVVKQKLDYIHNNPVKAGYCTFPEDYKYCTAGLYLGLPSAWDFVTPCFL